MTKGKTKKKQKISFQLKEVELLGATLNQPPKQLPEKITYHFNIKLEYRINLDSKFVFVVTSINVSDENYKETLFGHITTSCKFEIQNFDDFVDREKKKADFPDEILYTLNSIAVSTTRGVMFSQFRGTFLHQAHLPLIDPKSFKADSK